MFHVKHSNAVLKSSAESIQALNIRAANTRFQVYLASSTSKSVARFASFATPRPVVAFPAGRNRSAKGKPLAASYAA